ncbi:MAG: molybdopterin biosynthesis protein [Acidimicrobiia bacterium]|nr:molybdopterin biosynthesis protein [Acidimicrobiia bacterium]
MRQRQFLDVVDEAEARRRFAAACAHLEPQVEEVPLNRALGRVLAADVFSPVDVPAFDRANVDGFAVRAADTFGAEELHPVALTPAPLSLAAGQAPPEGFEVAPGQAVPIATGGVIPRGADAVVMVEDTIPAGDGVRVQRPAAPGSQVTFAGSDIGRGDLVLLRRRLLTSRETGVLAAIGVDRVPVFRRPRVAVISTGDEIVAPGGDLAVGRVYDSNQRILLDAVAELGGEPLAGGVLPDDESRLEAALAARLTGAEAADLVLLSGGTSKGEGDLNAAVVHRLAARLPESPGVVVHGVALKPGKPLLLAVVAGRPVVVLPGFPTSAIFTFHEFVAPLIRRLGGGEEEAAVQVDAMAPLRITSVPGRTEYVLVDLVEGPAGLAAYPLGAGSGSVTALARADGFVRIPAATEYVAAGEPVTVRLLHRGVRPADLVAVGSHCVGLDHLLGLLAGRGLAVKSIPVGSTAGLAALARGEGDVAGIHLLDEATGEYNRAFLPPEVDLVRGYGRRQGVAFRRGDPDFDVPDLDAFLAAVRRGGRRMVNRNPGSGTRVLLDRLLGGARPEGYYNQPRTHHAVAAAVAQGRADWGMTIDVIAAAAGLGFLFVQEERYDLAVRRSRRSRPAVAALLALLEDEDARAGLRRLGFTD